MSDSASWERANEDYLEAALAWLRLRLQQRAPLEPPPPPPPAITPEGQARRLFRRGAPAEPTPPQGPGGALPGPRHCAITPELVGQARAAMHAAAGDPPPALLILAQLFGLSPFEQELLLLCAAMELDTRIPALYGRVQGDARMAYPTFALALSLLDNPTWEPLSPDRPLRYFNLIEIYQPPGTPLTSSVLRADERVVSYLKGLTYLDDRLAPMLVPLDAPGNGSGLPASHAALVERVVSELKQASATSRLPIVQLLGPDAPSKQLVARHAADALGMHMYRLPSELLPNQAADLERMARLWQRESILIPIALYLDAGDTRTHEGQPLPAARFLARSNGLFFVDTSEVLPTYGRPGMVAEVERPTAGEQEAAWLAALGPDAADTAAQLAGQFDLGAPTIERIARAATVPGERPQPERVWSTCLIETRKGLDALAQRIDPKATWDDLVLPQAELNLLRRIADQVGHRTLVYETWGFANKTSRGLGISALFAGPSGTGKTMAAEVIANHLRLNLYRIDLSAVVSKYIGETEKNLARMFDEAESGGVVLFFDEADALFGKRTEIRDSHDRYANIEINYLLQRMEAYRGLAILATNMKSALDTAFMRRLRFIVNFPYPGPAERRLIWEKVFPAEMRAEGMDFDRLAKLNFTGGNVFTIAVNAAFLSAREGAPIGMRHVLEAARAEARKLEMPINERDYQLPREEGKA
jgi:hypothetical protein